MEGGGGQSPPPPPPRCFLQAIFRVLIPTVFTSTNPEVIFFATVKHFYAQYDEKHYQY